MSKCLRGYAQCAAIAKINLTVIFSAIYEMVAWGS